MVVLHAGSRTWHSVPGRPGEHCSLRPVWVCCHSADHAAGQKLPANHVQCSTRAASGISANVLHAAYASMLTCPVHDFTIMLQSMLRAQVSTDIINDSYTSVLSRDCRFLKRLKTIQTSMKREMMLLVKTLMMQKMTKGG